MQTKLKPPCQQAKKTAMRLVEPLLKVPDERLLFSGYGETPESIALLKAGIAPVFTLQNLLAWVLKLEIYVDGVGTDQRYYVTDLLNELISQKGSKWPLLDENATIYTVCETAVQLGVELGVVKENDY